MLAIHQRCDLLLSPSRRQHVGVARALRNQYLPTEINDALDKGVRTALVFRLHVKRKLVVSDFGVLA